MGTKTIRATVEIGPNYLFHLVAVARAGFESDYADRYRESVRPADLRLLEECRSRLAWADGHTGDLTEPALFLPAYLGLDSAAAFGEYFTLVSDAARSGDCRAFLERYAGRLAHTADWVQTVDTAWVGRLASAPGSAEGLGRLGTIFAVNFPAYEERVWPVERGDIESAAAKLNGYLAGLDLIGRWEDLTGLSFRADVYEIILVSAIKDGPNANSVGHDRNVFYSGSDFGWLTQFVSHETGTHILIGMLKEFLHRAARDTAGGEPGCTEAAAYPFDLVYRAYENLARFYNSLILGTRGLYGMPDHYRSREFEAVYRRLHERNPRLSPREMLAAPLRRPS